MSEPQSLSPTPVKYPGLSLLAKGLAGVNSFATAEDKAVPGKKANALLSGLASMVGLPEAQALMEKLAYGERLTTGKGQTLKPAENVVEGALALAPLAQGMARGALKVAEKIPTQLDSSPNALGWHGTTAKPFDAFKPNIRKKEQLGFGIHFADERSFAERYALDPLVSRNPKGAPWLYKADLSYNAPLEAASLIKEGSPEFTLAAKLAGKKLFTSKDADGVPTAFLQNAIDSTSPERALRLIQDAGFDAVRYNSRIGELAPLGVGLTAIQKSPSTVVFSPAQVKILERELLTRGLAGK